MYSSKSTDYQTATITNNGFWPDIAAGEFEEVRAIPTRISHESVRDALLTAVSNIITDWGSSSAVISCWAIPAQATYPPRM